MHREGCKRSQDYTSRSCRRKVRRPFVLFLECLTYYLLLLLLLCSFFFFLKKLNWRAVFRRRSLIERNWMKGLCRITTIAYSSEITCIQTDETRIANGSYDKTVKVLSTFTAATQHTWPQFAISTHFVCPTRYGILAKCSD